MTKNRNALPGRASILGSALLLAVLGTPVTAQVSLSGTSYTENFDAIGSGLPTGWTVRTGATASALGSNATYAQATTAWNSSNGNFRNAASADGMTGSESSATQAASTDRALAVRQTGSFGDPGAAFVLEIDNTVGLTDFNLTFKLQSLDQTTPRTITWRVDYGFGATPTSFTAVTTTPATITTGGNAFTNQSVSVNFGNALNNQSGPVWVRVVTISGSSGSGTRPTSGIDDFQLSWDVPATPNTSVAFVNTTGNVGEGDGSTNLALAITNPDASNATTVTIGISGATGRVDSYSTSVTFPANSSANEHVVVTLDNDALCNGDEDVTFTITGISGGQGTPLIGGNDAYVLTVEDNETPVDPTATAATAVDEDGFTANWDAVSGATGYYLDVSTSPTFGGAGAHLAGWNFTDGDQQADSGTPANASQSISANTGAAYTYPGGANLAISTTGWDGGNGTKYWMIELETTGYGDLSLSSKQQSSNSGPKNFKVQYSIDGGGNWTDVPGSTVTVADNMTTGVLNNLPLPAACDNQASLQLRWIMTSNTAVNNGTVAASGTSRIDDISVDAASTPSFVAGYDNLFVNGTSQAVTGLSPATTYYYRVRSEGGCSTGDNSNTITVTTDAGTTPFLAAGTLADFGSLCINTAGTPQSFNVTGTNLTTDDVTVGPLNGFTFSTTELGTYTASLSIAQPGGSFSQDIWVTFTPTAVQSYDGNITVGGGGAADVDVAVTGEGINTAATASTGSASGIDEGGATVEGTIDDEGCSTVTDYGIEYSTTMGFTPGTGTQVPSTNLSGIGFSSDITGLAACTMYYYRAYVTNNGGTAYGNEASFETAPLDAPTATAASGILQDGFTANWNAQPGATGYRLDVSTSPTFGSTIIPGTATTETFTGISGNPGSYLTRNWTGVDGVEWAAYKARTDQEVFSGDPAIALQNQAGAYLQSGAIDGGVTSIRFDVVQVFSGSGGVLTVKVLSGPGFGTTTTIGTIAYSSTASVFDETFTPIPGPVMILVENNASARPAIDNLQFTRAESFIPSFVPGYEDLAVAGTSQLVSGLNTSTTYYYRVRAESGSCVSDHSNTIAATTLACAGNSFIVAIQTDGNGGQITWEVVDEANVSVAYGGPYTGQDNTLITENVCLGGAPVDACYGFRIYDNFGDGIANGGWELRTTNGKVILRDAFNTGYISPANPAQSPSYGDAHSFCLPLGAVNIAPTECGIFNNLMGNKVYAVKQAGTNYLGQTLKYQFEFSDPDAGFIRRIAKTTNLAKNLGHGLGEPAHPGVTYFAAAPTSALGRCPPSGLRNGHQRSPAARSWFRPRPTATAATRRESFNTNNSHLRHARGAASQYEFHITNAYAKVLQPDLRAQHVHPAAEVEQQRGPPLVNGSTWPTWKRAMVSGMGKFGSTCTITIDNGGARSAPGRPHGTAVGNATPVAQPG